MTWLVWRQHRSQLAIAGLLLVGLVLTLLLSGLHIDAVYRSALATCKATNSCNNLGPQVFAGDEFFFDVINLTLAAPLVLGVFFGTPLVAREVEQATDKLVWMQTVTRRRWFTIKVGWVLLATAIWGGALALLVTWWSGLENAIDLTRFQPGQFDLQGVVPLAYALFAVALGIAAGAVIRRTVPAIAVTIGAFVGLRLLVTDFVRKHYISPVTKALPVGSHQSLINQNVWTFSAHKIVQAGRLVEHPTLPKLCHGAHGAARYSCLSHARFRQLITYEPGNRYWSFQEIEAALFILLAVALIAVAAFQVALRDA